MYSHQSPKISVIVPVYNVEKYLPRCIDSILSQTFTDFELLLIDDGSPDNCGKICDEYAAKDSRVRVFHKPNGGVSSARNLGLDKACGEWITFIDSDDYVDSDHFWNYMGVVELDSDVVIMGRKVIDERGVPSGKIEPSVLDSKTHLYGTRGVVHEMVPMFNLFYTTWNASYRKELLQKYHIRFDENVSWGEDTIFSFQYLVRCNRIQIVSKSSYFYIKNNENASNRYHKDLDKGVRIRIPFVLQFLQKSGFTEEELKVWELQQNYLRIKWAIGNLYKSNCPLSLKEKIKQIRIILKGNPSCQDIIKECGQKGWSPFYSKVQDLVIYIGSPVLIHIVTYLIITYSKFRGKWS